MDHLRAAPGEAVHDLADGPLVTGDRVRAQYDHVAVDDVEPAALTTGHQRKRRHRLTLRARREDAELAGIDTVDFLDVDDRLVGDVEEPQLAGERDVLHHRPAEQCHAPAARDGGFGELLDAVHVARETGHDDAPPGMGVENPPERLADQALTAGEPWLLGVRRVREQEPDAHRRCDLADPRQVGAPSVDRRQVELEVARVKHDPLIGVEGRRETVRHRVRDGYELDVEGPDAAALAIAHRNEFRRRRQVRLVQPVAGDPERERRAVDRHVHLRQQVGDRPDVVLVPVRKDDPVDVARPVGEE